MLVNAYKLQIVNDVASFVDRFGLFGVPYKPILTARRFQLGSFPISIRCTIRHSGLIERRFYNCSGLHAAMYV